MLFSEYELWPQDELDIFTLSGVPEVIYQAAVADGTKYLNHSWPALTAEMFTDYASHLYKKEAKKRRIALSALALSEYLEKKGRFMTDIINGIWVICEETTWNMPDDTGVLKDIETPKFDTHSSRTASLLSTLLNLFSKDLPDAVKKRITYEVKRRCLLPFLEARNHTPENVSYTLISCIFTEPDEDRRRMICDRVIELLENFLEDYSADSGKAKSEQSLYIWSAYLYDILEMLYCATDNKLAVFSEEKIMLAAKSIYKSYLGSGGFSEKSTDRDGARIYLFGKRMDYRKLMDFGASEYIKNDDKILKDSQNLFHKLYSVKHASEIIDYGDNFDSEECGYIDSMDIFIRKTKGFSVAVKGGLSSAGNLMVYLENEPYVVDLEKSHNLPVINGFTQFSNTRRASCVKLENGLKIDLSETYPKDAGIIKWVRSVEAEERYVIISDEYELSRNDEIKLTLLMKEKPILSGDRIIIGQGQILWEGNLSLRVELVKSKTYKSVYRLIFRVNNPEKQGTIRLAFKI